MGIDASLLEPAVSSGALHDVIRHALPDDPYGTLSGVSDPAT